MMKGISFNSVGEVLDGIIRSPVHQLERHVLSALRVQK